MKRLPYLAITGLAALLLSLPIAAEAQGRGGFGGGRGGFGGGGFGGMRGGSFVTPRSGFVTPRSGFVAPRSGFVAPRSGFSDGRHFDRFPDHGFRFRDRRSHGDRSVFFFGGSPYFYTPYYDYPAYYDYPPYYSPYYPTYYPPVTTYTAPEVYPVEPAPSYVAPPPASGTLEFLRSNLGVRALEGDTYQVQWLGANRDVTSVEFRVLGPYEQVIDSEITRDPPFQVELQLPEEAQTVEIVVRRLSGVPLIFHLSRQDFLSLAR